MHDITFGITTFNRPQLLQQLVDSILVRYPSARITVADNGNQRVALSDGVKVLTLPFDCGLSEARNALIDDLETEYLLILEDDFQFTGETDIAPLRHVLRSDPEIGCVGGAIRGCDGRVTCYALDIEVCRDKMRVRDATHRVSVTPTGIPFRFCDMVWNFALFRREMLREHRWIDALKIGEHCPYFYEVKRAGRWRVASCSLPKIYHVPQRRPKDYLKYRQRAADFFRAYLAARDIRHYERVLPYHYENETTLMPPVLVLAVGHSGTSVATRMMQKLGWNLGHRVDKVFAEHIEVRRLNRTVIDTGRLDHDAARRALSTLPMPWALKDPRFVQTLQHWLPVFAELSTKPVLLRLRRDLDSTKRSYRNRNAPGDVDFRIEHLARSRDRMYELWPWSRMTIEYENLAAAVAMFDLDRFGASSLANERQADETEVRDTAAANPRAAMAELDRDSRYGVMPPMTMEVLGKAHSGVVADSSVELDSSMLLSQISMDSSVVEGVTGDSSVGDATTGTGQISSQPTIDRLEAELRRYFSRAEPDTMSAWQDGSGS